jgi:hypothetical protein
MGSSSRLQSSVEEHGQKRDLSKGRTGGNRSARQVLFWLQCVKHPLAQKSKSSLSVHLSFDELSFRDKSLHHAIVDGPGETRPHGGLVFLDTRGKGLAFGKAALCDLGQPGISTVSFSPVEHGSEVLNEGIRTCEGRAGLTERCQILLFPLLSCVGVAHEQPHGGVRGIFPHAGRIA